MVGKLIKNEFKANLTFLTPIYIVSAVLAAILYVIFIKAIDAESAELSALLIIGIGLVGLGIFIGTIVSIIINFNKSMFKDQGYLTFTLPVRSSQLLFAKAFSSFCWILFSYIINVLLFAGAFACVFFSFLEKYDIEYVKKTIQVLFTGTSLFVKLPWEDPSEILWAIVSIVVFAVIYIFVSTIYMVSQVYFSVSLSNVRLFQRFGIYSTIGIYFAVLAFSSTVSSFFNQLIPFHLTVGLKGMQPVYDTVPLGQMEDLVFGAGDLLFPIVATVFFFIATSWFMKHKINLK